MPTAFLKHRDITDLLLKAFYAVYHELGFGFLEKVYENALAIEARSLGLVRVPRFLFTSEDRCSRY